MGSIHRRKERAVEQTMFCYQCEQTARGTGCTYLGICGKDAEVAALQDLLVYQLEGLAYHAERLRRKGLEISPAVGRFSIDALFATLTNVNFDPAWFVGALREAQAHKETLRAAAWQEPDGPMPPAASYTLPADPESIKAAALHVNIRPQATTNADLQSLHDTLLYGMKGMAAYAHHARVLGYSDADITNWLYRGLSAFVDDALGTTEFLGLLMEFGQVNLRCLELLDKANTETFGHPEPVQVRTSRRRGPFIIVSGHDLQDLAQLLRQTADTGIRVYTHGEMLPAHGYPALQNYSHLAGNYGGAWYQQQQEFDGIPGAILMTTNCLVAPWPSYQDRIFNTGVV